MSNNKNDMRPFGMADKIGYAFGDFGNDFTFILSSTFMMKFYTDIMGISSGLVGLLMMMARFVDAFTDVTMGQIVDHSKPSKDGKFKPWIKRMCGPVAISSFLIYQSEFADMSYGFKVFWMFFTYILWGSIFYTAVNIPYGSMVSAISSDPKDRADLSTFRNIGATLAGFIIGVGTPVFAYVQVNGQTVLSGPRMTIIAGVFSICAVICYLFCFNLTRERVEVPQNTEKVDIIAMGKKVLTNRALLGIIVAAIFLLLGSLGMNGMNAYIFPAYYNNGIGQSVVGVTGAVGVLVICAPAAAKLATKFGKKEVSAVGCLLGGLIYLLCFIVRPSNMWGFVVFYTVVYIALGFFNTLIWAMITDVIDDAEIKNSVREDGTIYAIYSFARKLGQAFCSGMIGGLLELIGYDKTVALNPSAYPEVLSGIFNIACLLPAIGLIAVAISLWFIYPLGKTQVEANVAALAKKYQN